MANQETVAEETVDTAAGDKIRIKVSMPGKQTQLIDAVVGETALEVVKRAGLNYQGKDFYVQDTKISSNYRLKASDGMIVLTPRVEAGDR